jgi:hypothetical protein
MTDPRGEALQPPLPLGMTVKPWGKIAAIASLKGERYYFFDGKGVAMIPAFVVEQQIEVNNV